MSIWLPRWYIIKREITMKENLNEELLRMKKKNNLNNGIIIAQLVVLLFVCVVAVYVRVS